MTLVDISHILGLWVSQYIAGFCLITIALWAGGSYLWSKRWQQPVRDSGIYLLAIGLLTLILALRPTQSDAALWPPLTWFCFSMLIVMELLWLSFLVDAVIQGIHYLSRPQDREKPKSHPPYGSHHL